MHTKEKTASLMSEGAEYERPSCELPRNYKISTGYDADRVVRGRRLSGGGRWRWSRVVYGAAVVVAREEQRDREVEKRERRMRTAVERGCALYGREMQGLLMVAIMLIRRWPVHRPALIP